MARVTIWHSTLPDAKSLGSIPPDKIIQTAYLEYYDGKQDQILLQQSDFPASAVFNSSWVGRKEFAIVTVPMQSEAHPYLLEVVYDDVGTQYFIPTETLRKFTSDPITTEVFRFEVNPANVTIKESRVETPMKTKGGWEIQVWGEDTGKLSMRGKIVGLNRDAAGNPVTRIVDSAGYQKFLRLRSLYIEDHSIRYAEDTSRIGISYRNDIFVGHFDSFEASESSESPFTIDFAFIITTEQRIGSPHYLVSSLHERTMRDRAIAEQLSDWSSERLGL